MGHPALSCIATWFNKKRGIANGILVTGSSLGGVIFPIMANRLITTVGYGWTMRACAFLILFLLIIAVLTVRSYDGSPVQLSTDGEVVTGDPEVVLAKSPEPLLVYRPEG